MSPVLQRWLSRIALLVLLALTFWARTYNRADVFHNTDGRIYFIEGDCYSRMERARMVTEGQWVIRRHDFENWPTGTMPHTTAPMDWLIVGVKGVCDAALGVIDSQQRSPLRGQSLDLAGAIVSPLLAVLAALWLWWWAGWMRLPFRGAMVFFFAVSPVLVHGTVLGRPDHQSLALLFIAIAVGAELALADLRTPAKLAKRWALTAGLAWGLALWVSLYEPLIFFGGAVVWHLMSNRAALFAKAVRSRWFALGGVVLVALLVDGWRLTLPDQTLRQYFLAWSSGIGELKHLDLTGTLVWKWLGLFWITAPVLLWFAGRLDARARGILPLFVVMLALTMWQLRWGYFIALAIAISMPWQLAALRSVWLGWLTACVAMAPLLWGWSDMLNPDQGKRAGKEEDNAIAEEFRNLSLMMRSPERQPFLAPWWFSPQIAYWSGQPGVAGTSHQSLAGTVDSARFFMTPDPKEAAAILKERGVRWVVIHDLPIANTSPSQYPAVNNSAVILGRPLVAESMGWLLAENPRRAPAYLRYVTPQERGLVLDLARKNEGGSLEQTTVRIFNNQFLKLYEVIPNKL